VKGEIPKISTLVK